MNLLAERPVWALENQGEGLPVGRKGRRRIQRRKMFSHGQQATPTPGKKVCSKGMGVGWIERRSMEFLFVMMYGAPLSWHSRWLVKRLARLWVMPTKQPL
jgi:hypothetical protein